MARRSFSVITPEPCSGRYHRTTGSMMLRNRCHLPREQGNMGTFRLFEFRYSSLSRKLRRFSRDLEPLSLRNLDSEPSDSLSSLVGVYLGLENGNQCNRPGACFTQLNIDEHHPRVHGTVPILRIVVAC